MPATVNTRFSMYQDNKLTLRFTVRDGDQAEVGGVHPVFDLTGFTVQWALSRGTTSQFVTTASVLKSSAQITEIEVTDAVNGLLEVKLVGADTATIFGDFYYELELVDGMSEKVVVAVGEINIIRNVSNVAA